MVIPARRLTIGVHGTKAARRADFGPVERDVRHGTHFNRLTILSVIQARLTLRSKTHHQRRDANRVLHRLSYPRLIE